MLINDPLAEDQAAPVVGSSLVEELQRLIDEPSRLSLGGEQSPVDHNDWLTELLESRHSTGADESESAAPVGMTSMPLRIGRFELLSVVGAGGFGIVFRARDPKLDRVVALKVLRPEAAHSPKIAARFV